MKERIYSIPLTDALRENCGCILCTLEKNLEENAIQYFLGPSLMEPDGRELTNKEGFCRRHMKMLLEGNHRLGLALMLETHIPEVINNFKLNKKGLFGYDIKETAQKLYSLKKSCAVCNKLSSQLSDAAENLVYLWKHEEDFKKGFEESCGLCLEHMALVLSVCEKELGIKAAEFSKMLINLQKQKFAQIEEDVHEFTLSFDYRNTEKPSEKVASSVNTAAQMLVKF